MKKLLFLFSLQGCVTPISDFDWYHCEAICDGMTVEACRNPIDGLKCRCHMGKAIEVGEPPKQWGEIDGSYRE